jgi:hypothetical protein
LLKKRGQAIGAFVALANIFFVSLAGTLPRLGAQVIIVMALVSVYQIARESILGGPVFRVYRGRHCYGLLSLAIYALELIIALRVSFAGVPPQGLAYLLLSLYGYALGTS